MNKQKNALKILKKTLGSDFFQELKKSDIFKRGTRTVASLDDMYVGLQIVPRTVMSFLVQNLSGMNQHDNKEIPLPFGDGCVLSVEKKESDTFNGYIYSKGKKIHEFEHRTIPGIGLIIMSTFELYDVEQIKEVKSQEQALFDVPRLQALIDERMQLHSLVAQVVDNKLAHRDAVEMLIREKLAQKLFKEKEVEAEKEEPQYPSDEDGDGEEPVEMEEAEDSEAIAAEELEVDSKDIKELEKEQKQDKLSKFKEFVSKTKKDISVEKREIQCPDCGTHMYKSEDKSIKLCICYGEDWNKDIRIKKNENSITMRFPDSMDKENIELLIQTLKQLNRV